MAIPLAYGRVSARATAAAAAGELVLGGPRPADPDPQLPDWACTGPAGHRFTGPAAFRTARTTLIDAAYARHTP